MPAPVVEQGVGPETAQGAGPTAGSVPVDIDDELALGADCDDEDEKKPPPAHTETEKSLDFWARYNEMKKVPTTWVRHHVTTRRELVVPLLANCLPFEDGPDHYFLQTQRLERLKGARPP